MRSSDHGATPPLRSPLRILRLTPHFHREGRWPVAFDPVGGLQTQVYRLAAGLAEAGVAQTVLTSHIPGSVRQMKPHPALDVRGVGFRLPAFLAGSLIGFAWFVGALPHLVGRQRYDAVHVHFSHSFWCRALAVVARRRGLPVVVSLNTALWGGLREALRLEGSPFDLPRHVERLALAAADRIVALTSLDADGKAADLRLPPGKVTVVPDAIDPDRFACPPTPDDIAAFRRRHGVPEGRPVVAYVGRVSPEKGWPDLAACAARLPGAFLLVCGDGPDRPRLQAALHALGRPGDWTITGFLDQGGVRIALALADVLVLPSRREAFGSVLLEAMACGVPAVAYSVGGIAEVAGDPPAVRLVPPGDTSALVAAVGELLDDPGAGQRLAGRGRERVGAFTIDASVRATLKLYHGLAGAKGRTPATR